LVIKIVRSARWPIAETLSSIISEKYFRFMLARIDNLANFANKKLPIHRPHIMFNDRVLNWLFIPQNSCGSLNAGNSSSYYSAHWEAMFFFFFSSLGTWKSKNTMQTTAEGLLQTSGTSWICHNSWAWNLLYCLLLPSQS
jgi:hypothetical protein